MLVKESAATTAVPVSPTPPPVQPPPDPPRRRQIRASCRITSAPASTRAPRWPARYFAPAVDYFEEGKVDLAYIRRDVEAYHRRWPQQSQQFDGAPKITIAADGRSAAVDYTLRFDVRNGPSYVRGRTNDIADAST